MWCGQLFYQVSENSLAYGKKPWKIREKDLSFHYHKLCRLLTSVSRCKDVQNVWKLFYLHRVLLRYGFQCIRMENGIRVIILRVCLFCEIGPFRCSMKPFTLEWLHFGWLAQRKVFVWSVVLIAMKDKERLIQLLTRSLVCHIIT